LTRNEMMAARLVTAAGRIEASGSGYDPAGTLSLDGKTITAADRTMPANDLIRTGLLCNDARLAEHDGRWQVVGDPMEGALIALAIKSGLDIEAARQAWTRLDEIPFDSQHRFMATLNRGGDGRSVIHVKGAPEKLLSLCAAEARPEGTAALDHERWTRAIAQAAAEGQRVLGFAVKPLAAAPQRLAPGHVEGALFLGIVGFIDPPREEAIAAVAECRSAGIAVKMITGDHAATALAIAGQLRLADKPEALLGAELDRVGPRELPALARRATVFARTSPEHKLRIVQALQSAGDVVAMTGDGVNDAPSLKQADIGIAMGRKGTEAAKEAAEMVLADDNFASIVAAVREGRTVYDNLRKVIAWTLPTNGGEAMVIVSAILLGFSLPLTPAQVLWINMLTAVTLGLVLAFEPAEPDIMQRPPRGRHNALLSPFLVWRVIFVSLLFTVASFSIFDLAIARGLGLEGARTMVVNTIVVLEIFYLFNVRYLTGASITWRGVLGTRPVLISLATVVAAQAAFTYLPPMQRLFSSRPLSVADGAIVMAAGILLMAVLEIEKALLVRLGLFQTGLGMPPRRAGPPDGPQPEPGP
jgi:magnesium-transporting ATPase (P-type)